MAKASSKKGSATPAVLADFAEKAKIPAKRGAELPVDADGNYPDTGEPSMGDSLVQPQSKVNVRAADNLAKLVADRTVHFDADCGLYYLDSGSKTTVIGDDGKVHVIETQPIIVDFSHGPVALSPTHPQEAEKIKLLRKDIEEAPQRAVISGLMEVGDGQIPRLMDGWDLLQPAKKLEAVQSFGLDAEKAIKFELQNPTEGSEWLVKQLDALLAPMVGGGELAVDEPAEDAPLVDEDAAALADDDEGAED